jgi:hypothetical protein
MRPPVHRFDWQLDDHKAAIALAEVIRPLWVATRLIGMTHS